MALLRKDGGLEGAATVPSEAPPYLAHQRFGLIPITPKATLPAHVLEWTSQEAFDHRLDFWKDPGKSLSPITLGTRTFAILPFRTNTYTARALAKFLKTKLALPTEEELQELLQKYPKDRRLALGAYLEFRRWVDDQGNPLPPGHSPWHTPPKGKERADPSTASSWKKGHSPRTPWWMNCYWNFLQNSI